jgi:dephospho-CoA kinase
VAEVPLLFESHQESFYDAVVAVTAPLELCIQRFCTSTGYGRDEYMRREANQLSAADKAKRANYVIENLGSIQELEEKATSLFTKLTTGEKS